MKKLLQFLLPLSAMVLLVTPVFASNTAWTQNHWGFDVTAEKAGYSGGGKTPDTIESLVGKIVVAFLSIIAIFFFGLMLYGGIRWMTARGNEEFVTKAKNIIEAAIIGLVLVLGARALATFVINLANK